MSEPLLLNAGSAELELVPACGGGIANLRVDGLPVLRPTPPGDRANPFALAAIVLLPFSNRIGEGTFTFSGRRFTIPRNLPREALPIHGDAFQRAWQVSETSACATKLVLSEGAIGPFRYTAEQRFALFPERLEWSLAVTNSGDSALPFGCGFHPWFPRTPATQLQFTACEVMLNDAQDLPDVTRSLDECGAFDFRQQRQLPAELINNGYRGWDGKATIVQAAGLVSLDISSQGAIAYPILYSPPTGADFFCFEPVSHPINAHYSPDHEGLRVLAPGERMAAQMDFAWGGLAG